MTDEKILRKDWGKDTVAKFNGKIAKLTTGPDRDGWVRLEYADGSPPQTTKISMLQKSTDSEWETAKRKAAGFDAKTWPYGTFVQAKKECEELVGKLHVKVKEGKVGRLNTTPDKNGQVKLDWPNGASSGLINVSQLSKVTKKEWKEGVRLLRETTTDESSGTKQLREGRGAPAPTGVTHSMYLTREHEMKIAFQMLDVNLSGELDRDQSRIWLRCMGWCLSDEDLDDMLSSVGSAKGPTPVSPRSGRTNTIVYSGRQRWTLESLTEVVDQNRYKGNSSLEAVTNAFRRLGNNRGKVPKERLVQYTEPEHEITGGTFDDFLTNIGMSSASLMDSETLSKKLLDRACAPASIMDRRGEFLDDT